MSSPSTASSRRPSPRAARHNPAVGATDTIEAEAACPQCGDIYYLRCETELFEPTYAEQRTLRVGDPQPRAHLSPSAAWTRLRDVGDAFRVLADDMVRCDCGCPCAPLLHFAWRPRTITLARVELLDARRDLTADVDLARLGGRSLAETLAATFVERPGLGRFTALAGPTRCEACGDTRERMHLTLLAHPHARVGQLFDSAWQGRAIMIGDRVAAIAPSADEITIEGDPGSWGCRCGAGPAHYVAWFERDGDALVLVDLALRAVL